MAKKTSNKQTDNPFIFKLFLFLILGSLWVWIIPGDRSYQLPLPVGPLIGVLFARHEHFQIDRKIEYAVLLVAACLSFWLGIGLYAIQS